MIRVAFLRLTAVALAAAALAPTAHAQRHSVWALDNHAFRRAVEVEHTDATTGREGGTAIIELETFGAVRPDGADVAVRFGRQVVPSRVVAVSPTGRVTVAFQTLETRPQVHVYFGHPQAEPEPPTWQITRGLYVASAEWTQPFPANWKAAKTHRHFAPANQGAGAVGRVHLGYNPFGPSHRYAQWFEGVFNAPVAGEYVFALAVGKRGFLAIGDELLADMTFRQPPRQIHPDLHRAITLEQGQHRLRVAHFFDDGQPACTVLWKRPDADAFAVMPVGIFTEPSAATVGLLERRGGPPPPDFAWQSRSVAYYNNDNEREPIDDRYAGRYAVRVDFEARVPPGVATGSAFRWEFGDGQTSQRHMPAHYYLRPGRYRVRLTIRAPNGIESSIEGDIAADIPWHRQHENYIDDRAAPAPIVAHYNLAALDDDALDNLLLFYYRTEAWDNARRVAEALLAAGRNLNDALRMAATGLAAEVVCFKLEDYPGAVALWLATADAVGDAAMAAQARLSAAIVALEKQYAPEAARRLYTEVLEGQADSRDIKRAALIGLGHVEFYSGRGEEALARYRQAAAIEVVQRDARQAQLARSSYARTAEDFIVRNEWPSARETLERWEWEYPLDRLDGHLALLWGRYYARRGEVHMAAHLLTSLQRSNPRSAFADQCLALAADCYRRMDKPGDAERTLRILKEEYPESPLAQ